MIDTDWLSFLGNKGFTFCDTGSPKAPQSSPGDRPVLLDLSHLGMLEVNGEEAFDFLQNQLANDLRPVANGASQLSAYCNPKGRVLALFRVFKSANGFGLIAPHEVLHSVLPRLRMYVLRAKVTIKEAPTFIVIGASGTDMGALLKKNFNNAPQSGHAVISTENLSIIGVTDDRWLVSGPMTAVRKAWERLESEAFPSDSCTWRRLDILEGLPQVFAATVENFIPQTINLDLVNGISFSKGCYPGQEIVARVRYLGKIKQRMICACLPEQRLVAAGNPVYSSEQGERRVGTIVDAQTAGPGMLLLIATPVNEINSASLQLSPGEEISLERVSLPYTIPEEQTDSS